MSATAEETERFIAFVEDHCPVLDTSLGPPEMTHDLVILADPDDR